SLFPRSTRWIAPGTSQKNAPALSMPCGVAQVELGPSGATGSNSVSAGRLKKSIGSSCRVVQERRAIALQRTGGNVFGHNPSILGIAKAQSRHAARVISDRYFDGLRRNGRRACCDSQRNQ